MKSKTFQKEYKYGNLKNVNAFNNTKVKLIYKYYSKIN